ncbi:MAG: MBL fold metallo-hydrolase [Planctomycetota bacterium]|jgi:L-ascorbate metabolism protein UlaG (beta-lactamase superfamily)
MAVTITWISHASFRIAGSRVVYIDPWKIPGGDMDGDVVFVSHSHHDHCSAEDVAKVKATDGLLVGPPDTIDALGGGHPLGPGGTADADGVRIIAVPAYNVSKAYHPKANNWLGAVIEMDGVRIYYAGDTDHINEMSELRDIDVALLPIGGTYTMDAAQAADAASDLRCRMCIPYHYGDIVGSAADAQVFAAEAACQVHVLKPGGSLTV